MNSWAAQRTGEAAPPARDGAEDRRPKDHFALFRVLGHRNTLPFGAKENAEKREIQFSDEGDGSRRFDAMRPEYYPLEGLILDKVPLLTEADILSYVWPKHEVHLQPGVRDRLLRAIKPSVWGVPFVVVAQGEPAYLGAFWTGFSSYSADMPTIPIDAWQWSVPEPDSLPGNAIWLLKRIEAAEKRVPEPDGLPGNVLRIELSQVLEPGEVPTDPRNNPRVREALQRAGKLIDPPPATGEKAFGEGPAGESREAAALNGPDTWGEPVDGVQLRVRAKKSKCPEGTIPKLLADFRNRGQRSLGIRIDYLSWQIEIDGKWFESDVGWGARRNVLPLEPGTLEPDLDVLIHPDDARGRALCTLTPGKHMLRVARLLPSAVADARSRLRVVSNRVEIEIVAEKAKDGAAPAAKEEGGLPLASFDRVACDIMPFEMFGQQPHHLTIRADGNCVFRIDERPARGDQPVLKPARLVHTLDLRSMQRLEQLLDATKWLAAPGYEGPAMHTHPTTYRLTVERKGTRQTITIEGERDEPYEGLLTFFRGLAHQEILFYQINWLGDPQVELDGLRTLTGEIEAMRGDSGRSMPPYEIDYRRFEPLADRILARPHDARTSQISAALKLAGYLKLERHKPKVARLLADREQEIRDEAARFLGDVGAADAIPALVDSADISEWAVRSLIRMGDPGIRALAVRIEQSAAPANYGQLPEVQRRAATERWHSAEAIVRVLTSHRAELQDQVGSPIIDAVARVVQSPGARAHAELRMEYFEEFLRLAASGKPVDNLTTPPLNRTIHWGRESNGLQAGLAFDLQERPYHIGELVIFRLYVRNLTDKPAVLVHFGTRGWMPTVHEATGKPVPLAGVVQGPIQRRRETLLPSQVFDVGTVDIRLDSTPDETAEQPPHAYLAPGTYRVSQAYRFVEDAEATWCGELTTGELDLVVVPAEPTTEQPEGVETRDRLSAGVDGKGT
ncbi:MAG: hypothetical protein ACYC4U_33210 [Pirellulaceae bacterium]